MILRVNNAGKM